MRIILDQIADLKNVNTKKRELKEKKQWAGMILGDYKDRTNVRADKDTILNGAVSSMKEIETDIPADAVTHAGFISYLHTCWSDEKGAVLRPGDIFNTIISEISNEISMNSNKYKFLFNDSPFKKDLTIIVGNETEINVEQIIHLLSKNVVNKKFLDLICNTNFNSDVKNAGLTRKIIFANMASSYFNYFSTMCGIPHLDILGDLFEWNYLLKQVEKLSEFIQLNVINQSCSIIASIIYHAFDVKSDKYKIFGSSKQEFFSDIFHYGKNKRCGSGHDAQIVSGWARVFYGYPYDSEPYQDLYHYSGHCQYVCVENLETQRKFCKVISLSYSKLENDTLIPYYGYVNYEILDVNLFNFMAKKTENVRGEIVDKLSIGDALNIIKKGKFYDPASDHYTPSTTVICDFCHSNMIKGYGYEKLDICETCAKIANQNSYLSM